jgi:integrase
MNTPTITDPAQLDTAYLRVEQLLRKATETEHVAFVRWQEAYGAYELACDDGSGELGAGPRPVAGPPAATRSAPNPVRDTARIKHGEKKSAVALSLAQVYDLRVKLATDQKTRDWDLLDFIDMVLATGERIGETCAITWEALDLDAGTVEIRSTVVRIKGHGLRIKPKPKSRAGYRKLQLPSWVVEMVRRRRIEATPNEWGVVFTSPTGLLRDPSNTQADLRDVFARLGYPWVTSHVFRKTAATLLDEAGVSARKIADQLGHSQVSVTQDFYRGSKIASEDAARVLEIIGRPDAAALIMDADRGRGE